MTANTIALRCFQVWLAAVAVGFIHTISTPAGDWERLEVALIWMAITLVIGAVTFLVMIVLCFRHYEDLSTRRLILGFFPTVFYGVVGILALINEL